MKVKLSLMFPLAAGVVLLAAAQASADKLVTAALPTSTGMPGACYVRNNGTVPIAVDVQLFSNQPLEPPPDFNNCNSAPLAPGKNCLVLFLRLPDSSYAMCSVTADKVSKLRGTLEIRSFSPYLRVLEFGGSFLLPIRSAPMR
jgi:hypothetical protein